MNVLVVFILKDNKNKYFFRSFRDLFIVKFVFFLFLKVLFLNHNLHNNTTIYNVEHNKSVFYYLRILNDNVTPEMLKSVIK